MKKIVFLDLQNTIIPNICLLNNEQKTMLNEINNSYNLIISSSVFPSDIEYFCNINNLNLNYIASSGSIAKINNKIYKASFTTDLSPLEQFKNDINFLYFEDNFNFYIYNYVDYLKALYPIKPNNTIFINNFSDFKTNKFTEIILCTNKNANLLNLLYQKENINIKIIGEDRYKYLFRIVKKHINKGYFIPKILELFNTSKENSLAIGDSREDLSMFEQVNLKIATSNAEDDLKNKCDIIVPSFLDNGALKYLINNKKD